MADNETPAEPEKAKFIPKPRTQLINGTTRLRDNITINGRVTKRTPEIEEHIAVELAKGTPMFAICREIDVHYQSVWQWEQDDHSLALRFARAREIGYDNIANDLRKTARGQGDSTGDVKRDRLIIETDLKLLAKWSKRYADRVEVNATTTHTNNMNVNINDGQLASAVKQMAITQQMPEGVRMLDDGTLEIDASYTPDK